MYRKIDYSYLNVPYIYRKRPVLSFLKRLFDIFMGIIGLLLAGLPMLIIAIIIKCCNYGPVIFKHERVGKNHKLFTTYKFRSMREDNRDIKEILGEEKYQEFIKNNKLNDDPRITPFGRFLRKTSLDELPQIFNILKGDMSVIGPRPITKIEIAEYKENADFLLKVRPGLTGFWTTHGRSNIDNDTRMKMELYYVAKRSVWLDIKIFFKTFMVVISQKGAS